MPNFNTLRYVNGYYKPGGAAAAAVVELESNTNTQDAFVVKYTSDGKPVWAARIGGSSTDTGYGVVTDSSGNVYAGGTIATRTYIYNANGTPFDTLLPSAGSNEAYIVKYNSSGTVQWVARLSSTGTDIGYAIAIDSSSNVIVIGQGGSGATVTAFNANGTAFGTTIGNSGLEDAILVKYNSSGSVQWVARVGSTQSDIGFGVATDSSGNVYVTGQGGTGVAVSFFNANGTAFPNTIGNAGGTDVFVAKYNSSGSVQWVARVASTGDDIGYSMATDSSGNVYIAGQGGLGVVVTAFSTGGVAFGTTLANAGNTDVFVVKYNTTGTVQWLARIASAQADIGYGIATDSSGSVYVTGQSGAGAVLTAYNANGTAFGTTLASVGSFDTFLVKYDTSGTVQWVTRMGSSGVDGGRGLYTDSSGNSYVIGQIGAASTFTVYNSNATTFGTLTNTTTTTFDAVVVKYNSSGTAQWAVKLASVSTDVGRGIAVDSNGNVYTTGNFTGSKLSLYGQVRSLFSTSSISGATDGVVVKYNSSGAPQWTALLASTGSDTVRGTVTDSSENLYITGGAGAATVTAYNANGTAFGTTLPAGQCFVVKYNSLGTIQWVTSIQGTGGAGQSIAVDASGNVYVTGYGTGVITAYNSNGSAFGTTLANAGINDTFLVKYNSSGTVQWVARIASTGDDIVYRLVVDSSGNSYITGSGGSGVVVTAYSSNGVAFGTTLGNAGLQDAFLVKYDTSGTVQWVTRVASTTADLGRGVAVDSSGNVYVTGIGGTTAITAYNANGTAFATTIPLNANGNAYLVKYNASGSVQWVTRVSAANGYGVAVDSLGYVYLTGVTATASTVFNSTGTTFSTFTSPGSSTDTFLVKYTPDGIGVWLASIISGSTTGLSDIAYGIATDSSGNVYLAGIFGNRTDGQQMTITNGDGSTSAIALGTYALVKFNTYGIGQWSQSINGFTAMYDVSTSSTGDVYVVGQSSSGTLQIMNMDITPYKILRAIGGQDTYVAKLSSAAVPQWAALVSSSATDIGYGLTTDSSANVYVFGQGGSAVITTVYNADGTAFGTTLPNAGANDAILAKYNTSGSVQWVARIASTLTESGFDAVADSSGNVYVTGQGGNQTLFFYNANGTSFGSLVSSGGDAFVAKYNSSGTVQWITRLATSVQDIGYAVAVDVSGDLYITGAAGAGVMGAYNADGSLFATTLTSAGAGDVFVAKYSSAGTVQWLSRIASTQTDIGYGIATYSTGSLTYVVGQAGSGVTTTAYNADGTAFATTLASLGNTDAFVVAYDTGTGFVSWVARLGGTGADIGYAITTDSSGNLYVVGSYGATLTAYSSNGVAFGTTLPFSTGASTRDAFIVKYNSSGTVQWVARVALSSVSEIGYAVCTDTAGNVYLGGQAANSVTAYNSDATFFGASSSISYIAGGIPFVIKYNSLGTVQWISSMPGGGNTLRAIAADSSSNLYVTGALAVSTFVPSTT